MLQPFVPDALAGPAPNRSTESLLFRARSTEYLPRCHRKRSAPIRGIFTRHQLIVLKTVRRVSRCWRACFLRRRLIGLNVTSKSLAKHADRTEFHCSRKLIAADRARALGLRAHGSNRPLDAIKASQSAWISSSTSAGSDTVRLTSSRKSAVYRFRNRWRSVLTAPVVTSSRFATSS
jgi:hypothetical protein